MARSLPRRVLRTVRPWYRPASALLLLGAFARAPRGNAAIDLHLQEQDLLQGRADRAVAGLQAVLSRDPGNATAHLLLCRTLLSELHGNDASVECRAALDAGLAGDSAAQDWAGRAFGAEAEHAGPIAGLKLAGKVRNAFQDAYRLNPRNPAAANDLGEFYIAAPALVGGGTGKADALASSVQGAQPEVAHRLRALLAEKAKDNAAAEREFLAATQVMQSPGAYVDLACFYVRQNQPGKGLAAARRAIALDHNLDANVVDAASTLDDVHQPAQAIDVLHRYLAGTHQSDQAPTFRVHTMLGEIFVRQGDRAAARQEFQSALAMAAGYAPAQKGLAAL